MRLAAPQARTLAIIKRLPADVVKFFYDDAYIINYMLSIPKFNNGTSVEDQFIDSMVTDWQKHRDESTATPTKSTTSKTPTTTTDNNTSSSQAANSTMKQPSYMNNCTLQLHRRLVMYVTKAVPQVGAAVCG
jgi:hypothetical protein